MFGGFPGGGQYLWVVMCSVTSSPLSILPTTLLFSDDGRSKFLSLQQHKGCQCTPIGVHPGQGAAFPHHTDCLKHQECGQPSRTCADPATLPGNQGAGRSPKGPKMPHGCLHHLKPETTSICAATPWCGDQGCFSMV